MQVNVLLLFVIIEHVVAATVLVEQGMLRGEKRKTVTGESFHSFKGIPYAAPPIGNLRFREPQPLTPWKGVRNATQHGSICPQVDILTNIFSPGSEDCLYLNVYSRNLRPETNLPVMFFIHGGGFRSGSGNDDNFGPDFIVVENVVLVTINYRLDALGFMNVDTAEVSGNAGLKDQVAALKWVKRNIASFGGDPNQVTIFGQSVGGSSCTLHAISPMSKGLFKRCIAMSGTAINDFVDNFETKRRAFSLGAALGFESNNATELIEFFRNVSVEKLITANPTILAQEEIINNIMKMYNFAPVVEKDYGQERFLIEAPVISVNSGKINNVDLILGYTNAEALFSIDLLNSSLIRTYHRYPEALVPTKIIRQRPPLVILNLADYIKDHYFGSRPISLKTMAEFVLYMTDTFAYDIIRYARALADVTIKKNIYLYQFSCVSERNVYGYKGAEYNITGAAHHDDLFYLFQPYKYNLSVNKDSVSYRMIKQTTSLFTNFAKYGNPTPDSSLGVTWSRYDGLRQNFLDIGRELAPGTFPQPVMMQFWKNVYDKAHLPFYF